MSYEVITYLSMKGRGAEAIDFYSDKLKAKVVLKVTYEDMKKMDPSMVIESGQEQWIAHCILELGVNRIMLSEETMMTEEDYRIGNNISLCMQSADKKEIETLFHNLVTDTRAEVIAPLSNNVFSDAYGIIKDPFGVIIQLNHDKRLSK